MPAVPGSQIFNALTKGDKNTISENRLECKGRASDLLAIRNKKLCYRYYYYSKIAKLNYQAVIVRLVEEFDLRAFTIGKIAAEMGDFIIQIGREKPTCATLRKLYPFMVWEE